jgi:hypothetical protein
MMLKLFILTLFSVSINLPVFAADEPIETIQVNEDQASIVHYFIDAVLHCPKAKRFAELTDFEHATITVEEKGRATITTIIADGEVVVSDDEGVGNLKIKIVKTQVHGRFSSDPATYVATVDTSKLLPGVWSKEVLRGL